MEPSTSTTEETTTTETENQNNQYKQNDIVAENEYQDDDYKDTEIIEFDAENKKKASATSEKDASNEEKSANSDKSKMPTSAPSAKPSTQGKTVYDEPIGPKQSSNDNSANQEVYGPPMPTMEQSIEQAKQQIDKIEGISAAEKLAANQKLDQIQQSLQTSNDKTVLKTVAGKLDHFITEYPWAGSAIRALSIVIKSVNIPGFVAAMAIEAKNMVVGELAAPAVSKIITEAAQGIKEFDPTLTDREAIVLAGSALARAGIISDAKSVLKGMNNILGKLDSSGGLAFAGVGNSKVKLSEFRALLQIACKICRI